MGAWHKGNYRAAFARGKPQADDTVVSRDHDGGMDDSAFWSQLTQDLAALGVPGPLGGARRLSGGCIHAAARITAGDGRPLFIKRGDAAAAEGFAAEADALAELAAPGGPRVPQPITYGVAGGQAYLVTEHVELQHRVADAGAFGAALAQLHAKRADRFGWHRDNSIGPTPQPNGWLGDWAEFWRERRLAPQLGLAETDGHARLAERGWRLAEAVAALLADHRPEPSLLHGDLWAGNYGGDAQGRAVLFDPASYYGDREADLAMTELFGGFPDVFYRGYQATWPLAPGYGTRKELYNLYHLLNHAHLFGGGYTGQARRTIDRLLAEIGA